MDKPTVTSNRRSNPRWTPRADVAAEVRRSSMANGEDVGILALEVSVGGARISVKEELLPGERVDVVLRAYALRRPLRAAGIVRWCTRMEAEDAGWCAGISFDQQLLHRDINGLFGR